MRCTVNQTWGPVYAYGINAGFNSMIADCVVTANGGAGTRWTEGIMADDGSSIIRCVTASNGTNTSDEAIYIQGYGGSVIDCVVQGNGGRGIMVYGDCLIRGNTCNDNYTGIYAYSHRNRIEGNICNGNSAYGIMVLNGTSNNIVIGNFVAQSANNYQVDSDNLMGPETTQMTNHPWANFSIP